MLVELILHAGREVAVAAVALQARAGDADRHEGAESAVVVDHVPFLVGTLVDQEGGPHGRLVLRVPQFPGRTADADAVLLSGGVRDLRGALRADIDGAGGATLL